MQPEKTFRQLIHFTNKLSNHESNIDEEKFKNAMWFVEFKPKSLHQNFINSYTLYLNSQKNKVQSIYDYLADEGFLEISGD